MKYTMLLLLLCAATLSAQKTANLTWVDNNPPTTTYDVLRGTGACPVPMTPIVAGLAGKSYVDNPGSGIFCYAVTARVSGMSATSVAVPVTVAIDAPTLTVTVASGGKPSGTVLNVARLGGKGCPPATLPGPDGTFGGDLCPTPAIAAPAQGSSFVDADFGGTSLALTPSTFIHTYALPSPFSASGRYVAVTGAHGNFVVDRNDPKLAMQLVTGVRAPLWHPSDDDVFYYFTSTQLLKYAISSGATSTVIDFTGKLTSIATGGSTHVTGDGWVAMWSEPEHTVCDVDMVNAKAYCADYLSAQADARHLGYGIDYSVATDVDGISGKRYAVLMALPALGVWSVDTANARLNFEARGPELPASDNFPQPGTANNDGVCDPGESCLGNPHGDVALIGGRVQLITGLDHHRRDLVAIPLADGPKMIANRTTLIVLGYESSYEWPDGHIGCASKAPRCVISFTTPDPSPFGNQIFLLDGLTSITKLAMHNSKPIGTDTYWCQVRAAISPDGKYVVYDSNFSGADEGTDTAHEQVMLIDTTVGG